MRSNYQENVNRKDHSEIYVLNKVQLKNTISTQQRGFYVMRKVSIFKDDRHILVAPNNPVTKNTE